MNKLILFLTILFCSPAFAGEYSPEFISYIKRVENGIEKGFRNGLWFPHASVEGGSDTIAYGHKIQAGEDFSRGITPAQAETLLIADLKIAEERARALIESKHNVKWKNLTTRQQEIFIDFQFNGVLRSFPKFTKAVLSNDEQGMRKEYKRYCQGRELRDRNEQFAKLYLGS